APVDAASAPPPVTDRRGRRLALAAFAISGAVAMCLEVLWSRTLALVIGSSIYSFTLVLVVFLVGIALGAWLFARPAARAARPLALLGGLFLGVAGSVLLTHQLADDLPAIFIALLESTELTAGSVMSL